MVGHHSKCEGWFRDKKGCGHENEYYIGEGPTRRGVNASDDTSFDWGRKFFLEHIIVYSGGNLTGNCPSL